MIAPILLFICTYAMVLHGIRTNQYNVRGTIIVFLIIGSLFSPLKMDVFGISVTNVSVIWYTGAIVSQTFLAMEFGFEFTLKNTVVTLKWLLFIQLTIYLLSYVAVQSGDTNFPLIVDMISKNMIRSVFSSYTAFVVCSAIVAIICDYMPSHWPKIITFVVATVVAQVFSSLTFYSVAFAHDPDFLKLMIAGTVVKLIMSMMYFPLIYVIQHHRLKEV